MPIHMSHIAGDEMLQTICLSNQPEQLLLILRCHLRFDGAGARDGIPITPDQ
jgi:hypothetical protein